MAHTIRRAMASDAETLARLRFEFRASVESADTGLDAFIARAVPWMRTRLDQGRSWNAWIAERDGAAIGTDRCGYALAHASKGLYERFAFTVRDDVMMRR